MIIGDVHLSDRRPVARNDSDWIATQLGQLYKAVSAAAEHEVPLVVAGDLFDQPKVSPALVNETMNLFRKCQVWVVPGNHDLLNHQVFEMHRTSLATLATAGAIRLLGVQESQSSAPWVSSYTRTGDIDQQIFETNGAFVIGSCFPSNYEYKEIISTTTNTTSVLVGHRLITPTKKRADDSCSAHEFMTQCAKTHDFVFTGDNHEAFEWRGQQTYRTSDGKRHLINVGNFINRTVLEKGRTNYIYLLAQSKKASPVDGVRKWRVLRIPIPCSGSWVGSHTLDFLKAEPSQALISLLDSLREGSAEIADETLFSIISKMETSEMITRSVRMRLQNYLGQSHD